MENSNNMLFGIFAIFHFSPQISSSHRKYKNPLVKKYANRKQPKIRFPKFHIYEKNKPKKKLPKKTQKINFQHLRLEKPLFLL